MTIEALAKVVPPPVRPSEAFGGPWEAVEAEVGTALPKDYKEFVRLYGHGEFMEFLGVHVPRCRSPYVRFESEIRVVGDVFAEDEDLPYAFWPSPGGLLVFGKTDFGDYLFWLTSGPPDTWRVVVWGRGLQEFEAFECGLTDFLAGLATGEINPQDFPQDMLPCDKLFEPYPETLVRFSWRLGGYGTAVRGVSTCRLREDR